MTRRIRKLLKNTKWEPKVDDDGLNLRYRAYAHGEVEKAPHEIAEYLENQSDAGSPVKVREIKLHSSPLDKLMNGVKKVKNFFFS